MPSRGSDEVQVMKSGHVRARRPGAPVFPAAAGAGWPARWPPLRRPSQETAPRGRFLSAMSSPLNRIHRVQSCLRLSLGAPSGSSLPSERSEHRFYRSLSFPRRQAVRRRHVEGRQMAGSVTGTVDNGFRDEFGAGQGFPPESQVGQVRGQADWVTWSTPAHFWRKSLAVPA